MNGSRSQPIDIARTSDERARRSTLEIVLPDLEDEADGGIERDNLRATQILYFACLLEEMRLFQVVEKVVELFREGLLPLDGGPARNFLLNYQRWSADRISAAERRDLYARAFGALGGASDSEPNRDFDRLWLRFLAAIASLARQSSQAPPAEGTLPALQEAARNAGRDLATNLSQHGYGIAYFAATALAQTIVEIRDLLRDTELRAAFGARDMWQVIELVSTEFLGGARNTNRFRTQSKAGAVIIRWLGNNAPRLANPKRDVVELEQMRRPKPPYAPCGHNPMVEPTDRDLVYAS